MADKTHSADQITAFLAELKTQSDRGVAVISASVLDQVLKMMLLSKLVEIGSERRDGLFEKIGSPLSSFSAKIELAFALGIINNKTRLSLHAIRDVRNKFAHRIEQMTFDHREVAKITKFEFLESQDWPKNQ